MPSLSSADNTFPNSTDLYVRFVFRNGSDLNPLLEYPLFGDGNSESDMRYEDFVSAMGDFSLDQVEDWCNACNSATIFCEAIIKETTCVLPDTTSSKTLSAPIAGVVGATVTIGLLLLIGCLLSILGFRIEHKPRAETKADLGVLQRNGSGKQGGFKGAEKLASDTDLHFKGGAGATVVRHERVGSWELNESPRSPPPNYGNLDKDVEAARVVSQVDYLRRSEDSIRVVDPFGDPVKAVDQV